MLPPRQAEKITSYTDIESYNCYGYAIKRKTTRSPSGSGMLGYNVKKVFEGVVKDVGSENIRRPNSTNDPISDDEYMVALRVSFFDYHFMEKINPMHCRNQNIHGAINAEVAKLGSIPCMMIVPYGILD